MRIGIPRSLLFYKYFPFWKSFFSRLGCEVVLSRRSTKETLDRGVKACVQDVCLPIKVALGHCIELTGRTDWIFLPRYLSLEVGTYSCPKIVAFTDMAKGTLEKLQPVLDPVIDLRKNENTIEKAFLEVGAKLGARRRQVKEAIEEAKASQNAYKKELFERGPVYSLRKRGMLGLSKCCEKDRHRLEEGAGGGYERSNAEEFVDALPDERVPPGDSSDPARSRGSAKSLRVGVLARSYCLYDSILSFDILDRLTASGVSPVSTDCLNYEDLSREASTLPFPLYWISAREIVGGAYLWLKQRSVDGIIYLIPFQCGPDALLSVLVSGKAKEARGIPFMPLVIDEHTGESGIMTRLEAFMDMLRRKDRACV